MTKRIIYSNLIFIFVIFAVNLFKHANACIHGFDFSLFCYMFIMDLLLSIKNSIIYFMPGILLMEYIWFKIYKLFFVIPFLTYSVLFFYNLWNDFSLYLNALYFEKVAELLAEGFLPVIFSLIIVYRNIKPPMESVKKV